MVREALRERFVDTLRELGGSSGNGRLRDTLGWQEDTYWSVHATLIEDGTVVPGRGRGGSVAVAQARSADKAVPEAAQPAPVARPTQVAPAAELTSKRSSGKGAILGFEAQLFLGADKLRKNLEPSDGVVA